MESFIPQSSDSIYLTPGQHVQIKFKDNNADDEDESASYGYEPAPLEETIPQAAIPHVQASTPARLRIPDPVFPSTEWTIGDAHGDVTKQLFLDEEVLPMSNSSNDQATHVPVVKDVNRDVLP